MANRRMFSLDVVDTDQFLEMPATSQNLYFHLGMRADDDGFVSAPKKITKLVNCGNDDLNVLISRGFVIVMDGGVLVIRHWKQNNYIQSDRYKKTIYQKQFRELTVNEGIYELDTCCIQAGYEMEAQVSIEIDNNILCAPELHEKAVNKDEQLEKDFEIIYALYPKKRGKTEAFARYKQWVSVKGKDIGGKKYHLTNRQIYFAIKKYIRQQEEAGQDDLQYWKNFDTLMGRQLLDYVDAEVEQ